MKTPSDELFKLIKSLSKDEKRLFKMFSRQIPEDGGMYLRLFDTIEGLEHYDEKKITPIFGKSGGLNKIKDAKRYLKEAIYKFLEYHHFDDSAEIQLQRLLQRIEILYTKRLFVQATKHLIKAEKIAIENHLYLHLLTILSWKREILIQQPDNIAFTAYEQEHYLSELQAIDLYRNVVEYQNIYMRVKKIAFVRLENLDKKTIAELKKILKNPLLKNEDNAMSLPAKVMYCRILGEVYFLLRNWEKSYSFLWRATGYMEQAKISPVVRVRVYANITVPLVQLKKSNELLLVKERAAELIRSQPERLKTISLHIPYLTLMNNYIAFQLNELNTDEALSASDEIMKLVEKHGSEQLFMLQHGNRSYIYFFKTDYRTALYHSNKVLAVAKTGIREDILAEMKIFNLVIHFELGNEAILPILCKSYLLYLRKQKQQHKANDILFRFFGKTIQKTTNSELRMKAFRTLRKEMELCKTDKMFNGFDFISWIESKIQNRPMIDILKEKSLKVVKV